MTLEVGSSAPTFTLPSASDEGTVSLDEYRGKRAVVLALFRGVYCPFCRHQIALLSATADKLRDAGIEAVGVVATPASRARLYFRFHAARIPLAADPDLATHRAYGVPGFPLSRELFKVIDERALVFAHQQGIAATPGSAYKDINAIDGYQPTADDNAHLKRHQAQFIGQFLIDIDGVVRWINIERAPGDFPSEAVLESLARGDHRL